MAKRQRPGLLDSIDMDVEQGSAEKSTSVTPMVAPAQKTAVKGKVSKTSLYLPPKAHHKLKEIALAKDCKVHDLVIDGINKVLAENGFPSIEEIAKT